MSRLDTHFAAALLGAAEGAPLYALDERARICRDRIHPEYGDESAPRAPLISAPARLQATAIRRYRLRADGVVEALGEHPDRAAILRLRNALRR